MKTSLLKSVDGVVGRLAVQLIPPPQTRDCPREIRSILIIRPGGIGDAALLAPTIQTLRQRYPLAHIHILAEKRNCGLFSLIPGIARINSYDTPAGLFETLKTPYDLVIDTEQWHRLSALVARLTGAPVIIGFDTNNRRRMLSHAVPYSHDIYEADSFLSLLFPLGIESGHGSAAAPFLVVPELARQQAATLLLPIAGEPFITLFPGASIRERQWGGDRFNEVVRILEKDGLRSVIVGGKDDRGLGEEIANGTTALNIAGSTSLQGTAAVIESSKLLLSGDSGILHIGVGLGVPTVSLFGPGIAAKWAPKGSRHTVLDRGLECSPCTRFGTTPPCPERVRCLAEITPEDVVSAVFRQAQFIDRTP